MKILAIRGKNLASLAGDFEVDFQQEPLASSGLFAISGPTGAGKSTLLDALCLALYDKTPRLFRAGTRGIALPDGKNKPVTPGDSGNLLRRGSAEAMAEVDFVGNDGLAYRATWSVRRAGGKASGSLQKTQMSLKVLPGGLALGATNSEVKAEIVQRIGLGFEQFTRAVLLAQNEFFAFLKADDNERGELLETLTGSAIYSQISVRAFEREKHERNLLSQLQARLKDQQPLDDAALASLQQQREAALAQLATLETRQQAWQAARTWRQTLTQWQQAEQAAQATLQQAQQAQDEAASRQTHFMQVESVQAARPLLAECDRLQQQSRQQEKRIAHTRQQLEQADVARQARQQACEQASAALLAAEQAQQACAPALDQAKALDAEIATLQPGRHQAASQYQQSQSSAAQAQQAWHDKQAQLQNLTQQYEAQQAWLAQHARLAPLAQDWPRQDTLLQQASAIAAEQQANQTHTSQLAAHLLAVQDETAAARQALQQAATALENTGQQRQQAQQQLATFDASALQAAKQALQAWREQWHSANALWQTLQQAQQRSTALHSQYAEQTTQGDDAATTLAQATAQLPLVQAGLQQAERSLELAQAACSASVEQLRASLQPDSACPVCGALDHPYARADGQLHELFSGLQAQVAQLRQQQQTLLQQQASAQALHASARQRCEALQAELALLAPQQAAQQAAWLDHPLVQRLIAALPDPASALEPGQTEPWLITQSEQLHQQQAHLQQQEQAWQDASRVASVAQQAHEQAASQHARLLQQASQHDQTLATIRAEHQAATLRCQEAATRLDKVLAQLDPAFATPDWRVRWHDDPAAFHQDCQQQVASWHAAQQALQALTQQLASARHEQDSRHQALEQANAQMHKDAAALASIEQALGQRQQARQALFDGKPVRQVESDMQQHLQQARARQAEANAAQQEQELARASLHNSLQLAQQQAAELQDAIESAALALDHWLLQYRQDQPPADDLFASAAPDLTPERLQQLLVHDANWLAEERKHLDALDQAVRTAHTVLRERQQQSKAQAAAMPAVLAALAPHESSIEALEATLQQLAAQRQEASAGLGELQVQLAQDAARRLAASELLQQIEAQAAQHHLWEQMSALIGSSDGKKFRNVAQQFTLDVLLGYANHHLAHLARRYRLQRIKDTLALMVSDRDMGDELRSVHSLSGGESFLVSLALALGLASLSSNRVKVESLFIDEGFGSLDADTLRVAMDALDGLQSLGRKVGVISHVQEMTERISTRIMVTRGAGGRSTVSVQAGQ